MLAYESEKGQMFELKSLSDIVDYMYICYKTYSDQPKSKETFVDELSIDDISDFCSQFEGKKKLMANQ